MAKTVIVVTKIFTSMTIGLVATMPFVFYIMVNVKYQDAYGIIPIYLFAVYFNVIIGLLSPIYLVYNETGKVAKSTICAALINIVVDILLVPFVGVYAAAISSLVAYFIISLWRLLDVRKHYVKIDFSGRFIVVSVLVLLVVIMGYYMNIFWGKIICFIIALIYALILNREILKNTLAKFLKHKK